MSMKRLDRFISKSIRIYQFIGAIGGIIILLIIIINSEYYRYWNIATVLFGFLFFISHLWLPFFRNEKLWITISIASFFLQSFYYCSNDFFIYRIINGLGVIPIFKLDSFELTAQNYPVSIINIGYLPEAAIPGWGINIWSVFLGIFVFYLLVKYYWEKQVL